MDRRRVDAVRSPFKLSLQGLLLIQASIRAVARDACGWSRYDSLELAKGPFMTLVCSFKLTVAVSDSSQHI